MDEFPTPEEEFEMMYSQELDMMREMENEMNVNEVNPHAAKKTETTKNQLFSEEHGTSSSDNYDIYDELVNEIYADASKKTESTKKRLFSENINESNSFNSFDIHDQLNEISNGGSKRKRLALPMVGLFESMLKKKSKLDPDLAIIDRIVYHRKEILDNFAENLSRAASSGKTIGVRNVSSSERIKQFTIQSRIPLGDFQSITTAAGERYYLNFLDEDEFNLKVATSVEVSNEKLQLLSQPYHTLLVEAQKELALMKSKNESFQLQVTEEDFTECDSGVEDDIENSKNLWVEKYRPKNYLDLLSDESTNRTVLQWVKLWDKVVFGRDRKVKTKESIQNHKGTGNKPFFAKKIVPEIIEEFDEIGRPQQKVLLLCGPPGLGKTTLAHIIARHAGYNVVEMNASDDRSIDIFKSNLENATSMKAVFGQDKKPNCLIIDEIDGAPAPTINFLVNVLQGKKSKGDLKPKKKEETIVLRRPIICICNNLYTPSLRPLRLMALIIPFPPTLSTRLAQRLLAISHKQNLKADLSVLMALCNKTENDIRSCLSLLQFVRSTSGELKFLDLEGATIGQKDYQRSLFSIWNDIFSIPRGKRQQHTNPHKFEPPNKKNHTIIQSVIEKPDIIDYTSLTARFNHVLKAAYSCGEYEKVTLGWFENYLNMKFKHIHMETVVSGLEWTILVDILHKEIHRNQNWMLNYYIPFSFVAYHYLFALHGKPKIQFPKQDGENNMKFNTSKNLIAMMSTGMSPNTLFYCPFMPLVKDILPYLSIIIQPPLRPVNVQLFNSNEKKDLGLLVDTMISYNLTYQQTRSPEGQYSFNLEPNIEEIVRFPSIPMGKTISYSAKQLISREIELEKMRRSERYFENIQKDYAEKKILSKSLESNAKKKSAAKPANPKSPEAKKAVPNHLQRLAVKELINKEAAFIAKDFFGRIISHSQDMTNKGIKKDILSGDIWFKFKEGYSNAVRRTVRLKDFF